MSVVTWSKTTNAGKCTSRNCCMPAIWRMEAGGVASDYCDACRVMIEDHLSGEPEPDDEPEEPEHDCGEDTCCCAGQS